MFTKKVLTVLFLMVPLAACGSSGGQPKPLPGPGPNPNPGETSRFFLPTGEPDNTTDPTVEVDGAGGVHMVYPAYAVGDAYYAYCPADCASQDDVSVVRFPTDGTVDNIMLALDSSGRPQVLMSGYLALHYATCSGDCTQANSWTVSVIKTLEGGDLEVSGEAFALDPEGRPRFMMHAYRAFLGVGQPDPATWYVTCDADCHNPSSWQEHIVSSDQIWQESQLRFTPDGRARLATVTDIPELGPYAAYVECNADCTVDANWVGTGLYASYSDPTIEEIDPAVSLDLTSQGAPRVMILGKDETGGRNLVYMYCDQDCTGDNWGGEILIGSEVGSDIGAGLDLALDQADRPRFVYTARSNILMAFCDTGCETPGGPWQLAKVEFAGEMEPDEVIPYPNCTVSAWFLRQPSIAIAPDGLPRVAYQAQDISGGWDNPDPTRPDCVAGTDMTFSRFAKLSAYQGM